MEDEELIRQQMEDTRESLTEKLETLEHKLADSVLEATSAVSATVATVKETVHDSVETVKESVHDSVESVKGLFDVQSHVREHPWMTLGGAIACGFVLGTMLDKPAPEMRRLAEAAAPPQPAMPKHHNGKGNGKHKQEKQTAPASDSWLSAIKPEIDMLKGLALGATFGTFREMIAKEAPPVMGEQIRSIIDGVTRKLGGDPIPSSDFPAKESARQDADQWGNERASLDVEQARW